VEDIRWLNIRRKVFVSAAVAPPADGTFVRGPALQQAADSEGRFVTTSPEGQPGGAWTQPMAIIGFPAQHQIISHSYYHLLYSGQGPGLLIFTVRHRLQPSAFALVKQLVMVTGATNGLDYGDS
jgi:hypothetical protein